MLGVLPVDVYLQYNLLYPNLYDFTGVDLEEFFDDEDEDWEWHYSPRVKVSLPKQITYRVLTR
jgi:hypothetical protein